MYLHLKKSIERAPLKLSMKTNECVTFSVGKLFCKEECHKEKPLKVKETLKILGKDSLLSLNIFFIEL